MQEKPQYHNGEIHVFMRPNITIILILILLLYTSLELYISVGFTVREWICLKNWNMYYTGNVCACVRLCYVWQYVCSYEFNSLCRMIHVICLQIVFSLLLRSVIKHAECYSHIQYKHTRHHIPTTGYVMPFPVWNLGVICLVAYLFCRASGSLSYVKIYQ